VRRLYLVKHASPVAAPDVPAAQWTLSADGEAEAARLAEGARAWQLRAIWSSTEPKAIGTASIMGSALSLRPTQSGAFDELRMPAFIHPPDAFADAVRAIFASPGDSIGGAEAASSAVARFSAGIDALTDFPACVVSHGRIICAWLAGTRRTDDAFAFWRALPLAGYVAIDLDDAAVLEGPFAASG
jgi:broad specificity phosphatase PhoE